MYSSIYHLILRGSIKKCLFIEHKLSKEWITIKKVVNAKWKSLIDLMNESK